MTPAQRKARLQTFLKILRKRIPDIDAALFQDLGKPPFEARISESDYIARETRLLIKNVLRWAKPERVRPSILNFPSRDKILKVPYGNVLVLAPWNYPFNLSLAPALAAFAAGNRVTIKPSELAPATARIISEIISDAFPPDEISVILGGAETAENLLAQKWDYIFFTGGTSIGRKVAEAAARNLTPVTLELGGKNPCLVEKSADLKLAAKRIVWGKFFNAGQTCIAPDFVLVDSHRKTEFVELLREEIIRSFGPDASASPDFARMPSAEKVDRLAELIDGETVFCGGNHDREQRYFAPTLLDMEAASGKIMEEEIFGPVLPVIGYDPEENLSEILSRFTHSLAFYVFSSDMESARKRVEKQPCGGACINDTVVHFANGRLPFGGIGNSGYGAYHGKFGFDTFTHRKSVLERGTWIDPALRYPPYDNKVKLLEKLLRWL